VLAPVANPLLRENEVLLEAVEQIRHRLPATWNLESVSQELPAGRRRLDRVVRLIPPRGRDVRFVVEVKRSLVRRDLPAVLDQLSDNIATEFPERSGRPGALPLVVSRYLPVTVQSWLTERNVSYADASGNLRIVVDQPSMFLRDVGATKDPWRGPGRPKGNLTGAPAAHVARALVDYAPPYSVPRLVDLAGASTGPTYRVVDFLQEQALLERGPRGPIEQVQWRQVLRRWSADYGFLRTNAMTAYLAPRGIPTAMSALGDTRSAQAPRYAVTGSVATQNWAAYAPARAAAIYCDDPHALASRLDLRAVDTGANVLLARPAFDVVYERTSVIDGVTVAAPSQVAVDLMTGPGRNPSEAEALLDWMENNVESWRR